jgi:four helix bundle protein
MSEIVSFEDLTAWQVGMDLANICFDIVEALPPKYRFIFSDQLLPASISIPSNIAEGSRRPIRAYLNHLSYSLGSQAELQTVLLVIDRRHLVSASLLQKAFHETERKPHA